MPSEGRGCGGATVGSRGVGRVVVGVGHCAGATVCGRPRAVCAEGRRRRWCCAGERRKEAGRADNAGWGAGCSAEGSRVVDVLAGGVARCAGRGRGRGRDVEGKCDVPCAKSLVLKASSCSWRRGGCGLGPVRAFGTRRAPSLLVDCWNPIPKDTAVSERGRGPRPQARNPSWPALGAGSERSCRSLPQFWSMIPRLEAGSLVASCSYLHAGCLQSLKTTCATHG